jgi:tRNA A37 methylthiotransferase MiaB
LIDSERIITRLRAEVYELAHEHSGTDLAIVNTCGFLDSAQAAAMAENGKVIVTGCMESGARKDHCRGSRLRGRTNMKLCSRRYIVPFTRGTTRARSSFHRRG